MASVNGEDTAGGDPPDISVVVAAYNASPTLRRAVRSALDQTGVVLEVIVVDDASGDDTVEVARALAAEDSRVVPVARTVNGSVSRARNDGLEVARGTWVTPLDADDSYQPGRLAAMLAEAERTRADLLADNIMICDVDMRPTGVMYGDGFVAGDPLSVDALVRSSVPGEMSSLGYTKPLMRREFLERHDLRYPADLQCGEDWYLYFRCLLEGARFFLLPDTYYNYAIGPQSMSRQRARMVTNAADLLAMHEKAADLARSHGETAATAQLEGRLPYLRRLLLKQRLKKPLLDIPVFASFIDRMKGRTIPT